MGSSENARTACSTFLASIGSPGTDARFSIGVSSMARLRSGPDGVSSRTGSKVSVSASTLTTDAGSSTGIDSRSTTGSNFSAAASFGASSSTFFGFFSASFRLRGPGTTSISSNRLCRPPSACSKVISSDPPTEVKSRMTLGTVRRPISAWRRFWMGLKSATVESALPMVFEEALTSLVELDDEWDGVEVVGVEDRFGFPRVWAVGLTMSTKVPCYWKGRLPLKRPLSGTSSLHTPPIPPRRSAPPHPLCRYSPTSSPSPCH